MKYDTNIRINAFLSYFFKKFIALSFDFFQYRYEIIKLLLYLRHDNEQLIHLVLAQPLR